MRIHLPLIAMSAAAAHADPLWTAVERDGRLEISEAGKPALAWQIAPVAGTAGGAKFAASAFIHPLLTPAGFECTANQPSDHPHHMGLWWPWKFVEVDGKTYNTWEIQQGQGAHVARGAGAWPGGEGWDLRNETVIKKPGAAAETVIVETTRMQLGRDGETRFVDLEIRQQAVGRAIAIPSHHYSGFAWRGPLAWDSRRSAMLTSGGHTRDTANLQPARWAMVIGKTPRGDATVLILSAAEKLCGTPEKLRVWDSSNHNGTVFINFNPVQDHALPLDDNHPAVSRRKYRIIAADRRMEASEADAAWRQWIAAPPLNEVQPVESSPTDPAQHPPANHPQPRAAST